jgi:hypothetical protein
LPVAGYCDSNFGGEEVPRMALRVSYMKSPHSKDQYGTQNLMLRNYVGVLEILHLIIWNMQIFALNFIHIIQIFLRLASKKSLSLSGKTQFQAQFNPRSYDCHNSSRVFWVFLTLIEAIVFYPFS